MPKEIVVQISQEHAEELIEISKRAKTVRDKLMPMMRDPESTEDALREEFIKLTELNREINDLYMRAVLPEFIKQDAEGLKQCSGWHMQMIEGLIISMIPMCPAGFREIAAKGSEDGPNVEPGPDTSAN